MGNLTLKQSLWYIVGAILVVMILKFKNEFFTINLDCVGAVRCLPDTYIDLC